MSNYILVIMYRKIYQYTHDIDWFAKCFESPIHVASNGGDVPIVMRASELQKLQSVVQNTNPEFDYELNIDVINQHISGSYEDFENMEDHVSDLFSSFVGDDDFFMLPTNLKLYSRSFIEMAKRGFYSFDRDRTTDEYFLVAWPVKKDADKTKISLNNISADIIDRLPSLESIKDKKLLNQFYSQIENIKNSSK